MDGGQIETSVPAPVPAPARVARPPSDLRPSDLRIEARRLRQLPAPLPRPRIGFLGVGRIGRDPIRALARSGAIEIAGLADRSPEALAACGPVGGAAARCRTLAELLETRPDGVVVATPSAGHAIAALDAGAAVFCQRPPGRSAREARLVVEAARRSDRLLAADLPYRHTAAAQAMRRVIREGGIGTPLVLDLTFHNAGGPQAPRFRDRRQSGGGCLIELGAHLVDLALWLTDWPSLRCTSAQLFADDRRIRAADTQVEDYAAATLETGSGTLVRIACSWNLPAGCEAVFRAEVYGTSGGVAMGNLDGALRDFAAHRLEGSHRRLLASAPDDWSGRAAASWAGRLAQGARFDAECERLVTLASALDAVYARA